VAGFTAEQVEEVRMVVRMLPVFLTTILYWTIYAQARAAAARCPAALRPRAPLSRLLFLLFPAGPGHAAQPCCLITKQTWGSWALAVSARAPAGCVSRHAPASLAMSLRVARSERYPCAASGRPAPADGGVLLRRWAASLWCRAPR